VPGVERQLRYGSLLDVAIDSLEEDDIRDLRTVLNIASKSVPTVLFDAGRPGGNSETRTPPRSTGSLTGGERTGRLVFDTSTHVPTPASARAASAKRTRCFAILTRA
jgi:hypothetical protein